MPVLVIAVSCLVIFGVMSILSVAAVHYERRQQVREEAEGEKHAASESSSAKA
ncbi:MAG TPA: hypothetical protein VEB03_00300 [Candidatus Nanoarchaeia archaeon]|nr:hypothetical protein [Candidatus Nanoarchaeia archaeon]